MKKLIIKKISNIETTIKAYLYLGFFWTLVGLLLTVLTETMLFLPALVPGRVDYGHIQPISSLALVFGAFLSFSLGLAYYILHKEYEIKKLGAIVAFVCMKLHELAIVVGMIAVLFGLNKGRELGEMPWIVDNILLPAFLAFPFILVFVVSKQNLKKLSHPSFLLFIVAFMGGATSYVLGNFGLPFGLFHSVPLLTGVEDMALGELYRNGLLFLFMLGATLGLLYYAVPLYYKTDLYSSSIPYFFISAALLLVPIASAGNLVYTQTPAWLQSLGIFCAMALNFAVIAGVLNASYTITRSSKKFHSDSLGMILRFGIFFLLLNALLRAIFSPRFMQAWSMYTSWNPSNLSFNLKCSGLLIAAAIALIILQILNQRKYANGILRFLAAFWISGIILLYIGHFGAGLNEYLHASALKPESQDLEFISWMDVFFSSSVFAGDSIVLKYLLSFRGIIYLGNVLICLGVLLCSGHIAYRTIFRFQNSRDSTVYEIPNLEVQSEPAFTG